MVHQISKTWNTRRKIEDSTTDKIYLMSSPPKFTFYFFLVEIFLILVWQTNFVCYRQLPFGKHLLFPGKIPFSTANWYLFLSQKSWCILLVGWVTTLIPIEDKFCVWRVAAYGPFKSKSAPLIPIICFAVVAVRGLSTGFDTFWNH